MFFCICIYKKIYKLRLYRVYQFAVKFKLYVQSSTTKIPWQNFGAWDHAGQYAIVMVH